MSFVKRLIGFAVLVGGVLAAESLIINHDYRRNPEHLEKLCGTSAFVDELERLPADSLRDAIIVVGGFMDAWRGYSYSIVRNLPPEVMARYDVFFRQHPEREDISRIISAYAAKNKKIIVIGHSWGADRAADTVLRRGAGPVDVLVTLDPVSRKGAPQADPALAGRWINVYIDYANATWLEQSNDVARIGGPWEAAEGAENIVCDPDLHHKQARRMFERHVKDLLDL